LRSQAEQVAGGLSIAQAKRLAKAGRAFVISRNMGLPDGNARTTCHRPTFSEWSRVSSPGSLAGSSLKLPIKVKATTGLEAFGEWRVNGENGRCHFYHHSRG